MNPQNQQSNKELLEQNIPDAMPIISKLKISRVKFTVVIIIVFLVAIGVFWVGRKSMSPKIIQPLTTRTQPIYISPTEKITDIKPTQDLSYEKYAISLKSRSFIPTRGIDQEVIEQIKNNSKDNLHSYIQFTKIPTQEQKNLLSSVGVKLLGYVSGLAWIASLPSDENKMIAISKMEPVRSIARIKPIDKITLDLSLIEKYSNKKCSLTIIFFEDTSDAEISAIFQNFNIVIEQGSSRTKHYSVNMKRCMIDQLSNIDSISIIGTKPAPPVAF